MRARERARERVRERARVTGQNFAMSWISRCARHFFVMYYLCRYSAIVANV